MITLVATLLSLSAEAAEPVDPFKEPDESELFRFEEQLVTVASRYAQTVRKAPSIVSLVTDEQIRQRGYRTLSDILRDLPGIYIWRGPEGRDLAAFRGVISADNNKLLILVDGQPWYDGVYTSGFIDEYFPIGHIRQIEVIKGPGSAIYGTNAFSGVVNIVTYGASDLQGARIRWQAGAHGSSDLVASAGGSARTGSIDTTVSAYARMLSMLGEGLTVTPEGAVDVPNTDEKRSVNVGAKLTIEGLQLQLHHVDYQHTYLFNGRENPYEVQARSLGDFDLTYRNTYFDARYGIDVNRDVTLTPYLSSQYHDNASAYFYGGDITVDPTTLQAEQFLITVDAEKRTRRWSTGLDFEVRPGIDHVAVGGIGVENTSVLRFFDRATPLQGDPFIQNGFAIIDDCGQVAGLYDNAEKCQNPQLRNLFGFAQYSWTATPSVELTAGARVDKRIPMNAGEEGDDGVFVLSVSPRAGVLLVPTDRTTAKLLYGRAIRAPNVRELLVIADQDPVTGVYEFSSGNINLVPENINTFEGELISQVTDALELRVDGSFSQLNNEIDKIDPGVYCNLPAALRIVGGEAGFDAKVGPASLASTYALTLASYGDGSAFDADVCDFPWAEPYAGRAQYEFPPHMLKSRAGFAVTDHASLWLLSELYSARPRREWSPDVGTPDGEAFMLLHLGMSFDEIGPQKNFRVGASVRNLADQRWNYGVYRDDSNEPDVVAPALGQSRTVLMDIEATF
jgi:outer membrane receptor protein involved in Fe transport